MPTLQAPHGAEARAYRATAARVHRDGRDEIELDLGLIGTGDIVVALPADVARDLARDINDCLEQRIAPRASGWLAGLRWRGRAA